MNTWKKFVKDCPRQYYDVQTKAGRLVEHCWAYQGLLNPVNGTGEGYLEAWQVDWVRVSDLQ